MDTTNSSENQQRRVEDRKPSETINWEAPGAPAVPVTAGRTPPANAGAAVAVFEGYDGDTLAPVFKLLGQVQPGEKLYLAGAAPAATSGDAPADLLFRAKVADLVHLLPWDINFADGDRATGVQVLDDVRKMLREPAARIERAAAPAPSETNRTAIKNLITAYASNEDADQNVIDAALTALAAPAASGDDLHHNFYTHKTAWRSAIEFALKEAPAVGLGDDDLHGYWAHELKAYDEAFGSLPPEGAAVSAATKPTADLLAEAKREWEADQSNALAAAVAELEAVEKERDELRSLLATKPAGEQNVPEGWMLVPKQFVTEVRRAAEIADSYSSSIDSIDEHGGEECEEPIWQIHHILYYAHAKLFGARARAPAAPTAAPTDQVRNQALEEIALLIELVGEDWEAFGMSQKAAAAEYLANYIRSRKSAATQTTEGAGNA